VTISEQAMTTVAEQVYLNGDVYDVLQDCDQLSLTLARLRRLGRMSDQDWRASKEHLAAIQARVEAQLTPV
jgi:hypothetical protein